MQQTAEYFRPYELTSAQSFISNNSNSSQQHSSPRVTTSSASSSAVNQPGSFYHTSMSPNVHHRLSTSMDNQGTFSINNIASNPPQHSPHLGTSQANQSGAMNVAAVAAAAYPYTPLGHHHAASLYGAASYTAFDYGSMSMPSTTHIPIDTYSQQQQQHQQLHQQHQHQQRLPSYPARPQPTRPVVGTDLNTATKFEPPMQAPKTSPARSQSSLSSSTPSLALKEHNKAINNSNTNTISSPGQNSPDNDPLSLSPSCPTAGATSAASEAASDSSKFRYPSGPNNSVQSFSPQLAGDSNAGPRTPSSALSSREGTPLPAGGKVDEPAPNVDISRVQIKEITSHLHNPHVSSHPQQQQHHGEFSPPPPPLPSSTFAQHQNTSSTGSFLSQMRSTPYGSFYSPSSSNSLSSMEGISEASSGSSQQQTSTITSHRPNNGVKIGRRPAHLPKVLKFSDKTLPQGWVRKLKQRKHGKQAGRWDVYIYSPCGVKFASRKKLKAFFEKNNLNYDPEDFDFTPYGRHIDSRSTSTTVSGSAHASGGSGGSSASRHNSSGSTGSDGTHPGSSPASISNYSPTHSSPYMPQSMSLGAVSGLIGQHSLGSGGITGSISGNRVTKAASVSSFNDYNSFAQFDPHMESPPNASALDVPGSEFTRLISSTGPVTLPYHHHLGKGIHHPIISSEIGAAGSDFFPAADMTELLGSATGNVEVMHNGFTNFTPTSSTATSGSYSADLTRGLQPLSNHSMGIKEEGDEHNMNVDVKPHVKQERGSSSLSSATLTSTSQSVVAATCSTASVARSNADLIGANDDSKNNNNNPHGTNTNSNSISSADSSSERGFSLGRTMSVLQESQEGFEDYNFYE